MEKKELLARAMEGFNIVPSTDVITGLVDRLFDPENITLITEIANPHAIAGIKLLQKRAEDFGLIKLAETYRVYIKDLNEAFVSYKRQSRGEVVEISKGAQFQEQESMAERHEGKE